MAMSVPKDAPLNPPAPFLGSSLAPPGSPTQRVGGNPSGAWGVALSPACPANGKAAAQGWVSPGNYEAWHLWGSLGAKQALHRLATQARKAMHALVASVARGERRTHGALAELWPHDTHC